MSLNVNEYLPEIIHIYLWKIGRESNHKLLFIVNKLHKALTEWKAPLSHLFHLQHKQNTGSVEIPLPTAKL